MSKITLADFLTIDEIDYCIRLYEKLKGTGRFADTVEKEIIVPNIERIDEALGQANHPKYLAYAVEYVMERSQAVQKMDKPNKPN